MDVYRIRSFPRTFSLSVVRNAPDPDVFRSLRKLSTEETSRFHRIKAMLLLAIRTLFGFRAVAGVSRNYILASFLRHACNSIGPGTILLVRASGIG